MTENNTAQPGLTDSAIQALRASAPVADDGLENSAPGLSDLAAHLRGECRDAIDDGDGFLNVTRILEIVDQYHSADSAIRCEWCRKKIIDPESRPPCSTAAQSERCDAMRTLASAPVADERAAAPGPWQAERPRNRSALIVWRWCQPGSASMRREYLRADGKIASTPGRFRSLNEAHAAIDRAALASAPVADEQPIKLSDDVLHFLKEGVENATQCEEADVDQEFADQLLLLMHTPLYTEPLPKQREVDWGPLLAAPVAGEAVTDKMIQAGAKAAREYFERTGGNDPAAIYRAMRAAAPAAPQASEAVRDALMAFDEAMSLCGDYPELQHHRDALLFAVQKARAALSAQPGAQKEQSDGNQ